MSLKAQVISDLRKDESTGKFCYRQWSFDTMWAAQEQKRICLAFDDILMRLSCGLPQYDTYYLNEGPLFWGVLRSKAQLDGMTVAAGGHVHFTTSYRVTLPDGRPLCELSGSTIQKLYALRLLDLIGISTDINVYKSKLSAAYNRLMWGQQGKPKKR